MCPPPPPRGWAPGAPRDAAGPRAAGAGADAGDAATLLSGAAWPARADARRPVIPVAITAIATRPSSAAAPRDVRAPWPAGRTRREIRSNKAPPVAACAKAGADPEAARSVRARAYWTGLPQAAATATSSQPCSRSTRMRWETHQTAGW